MFSLIVITPKSGYRVFMWHKWETALEMFQQTAARDDTTACYLYDGAGKLLRSKAK